jgi:hypothetical protein
MNGLIQMQHDMVELLLIFAVIGLVLAIGGAWIEYRDNKGE